MLPAYIKDAIIVSARYHAKAREKQRIVERWIEEKYGEDGVNDDSMRDILIDCVEQSNNPVEAIRSIESMLETKF